MFEKYYELVHQLELKQKELHDLHLVIDELHSQIFYYQTKASKIKGEIDVLNHKKLPYIVAELLDVNLEKHESSCEEV